ncbi:hypothetical protein D9M68_816330 [compost metagenome]
MVNSRTPTMNIRMKPEAIAGASKGITMRHWVVVQWPPEAAEASSSSWWICIRPARARRVVVAMR